MDNHYHLFIKTNKPNLSQGIHYLNSSYTNWFRNKHQIIGPLFQGRFKSILIDADNYALTLSAYIHLNPLRAGIWRKIGTDTHFLCNRLCKDINGDKRTGYSSQLDRAKTYG